MKNKSNFATKQYQSVPNLVPLDICKFATQALIFSEADYVTKHGMMKNEDTQVAGSQSFYGNPVTESLLVMVLPKIEEIVEDKLLPTYSYARIYRNNAILKLHRDRPSCEVSVSIQLASVGVKNQGGWAISMDGKNIHLGDSDGVVYNGLKVEHGRDQLICEETGFQAQVFLHYVRANGRFSRFCFDRRIGLGIS